MSLMSQLRDNNDFESLRDLGIKVSKNLETIKGRLIPMPKISLGDDNRIE